MINDVFVSVFCRDLDYINGWEMRKDSLEYSLNFTAPGVELHCMFGSGFNTVERQIHTVTLINLKSIPIRAFCFSLNYEKSYDFSGKPTLVYGDGDGTVNRRSLEACRHWSSQQKQPIYMREFPGADHMNILADLSVLDSIIKVLMYDQGGVADMFTFQLMDIISLIPNREYET